MSIAFTPWTSYGLLITQAYVFSLLSVIEPIRLYALGAVGVYWNDSAIFVVFVSL